MLVALTSSHHASALRSTVDSRNAPAGQLPQPHTKYPVDHDSGLQESAPPPAASGQEAKALRGDAVLTTEISTVVPYSTPAALAGSLLPRDPLPHLNFSSPPYENHGGRYLSTSNRLICEFWVVETATE
jgi:hypothetical protein